MRLLGEPPAQPPNVWLNDTVVGPLYYEWYDPWTGSMDVGAPEPFVLESLPTVTWADVVTLRSESKVTPLQVSFRAHSSLDSSGLPSGLAGDAECTAQGPSCTITLGPDGLLAQLHLQRDAMFLVISVSYALDANREAVTELGYSEDYVSYGVHIGARE